MLIYKCLTKDMLPEIGSKTKRILQALIIIAIFLFLGLQLLENWSQVLSYEWELNYLFLGISTVFIIMHYTLYGASWRFALKRLGENITLRKAVKVWMLSRIGWYIPGRVWLVLGMLHLAAKEGIKRSSALISISLDIVLATICALLVFLFTLPFWHETGTISGFLPLLIFIPLGLIALHPGLMRRVVNFLMRRLGREEVSINIRYRDIAALIIPYCTLWVLYGLSFYFLVGAVQPLGMEHLVALIGMYSMAWAIGFLSLITPGGLGIREGVLALLLTAYFPMPVAIVVSLLARAWTTLVEVAYILFSFKL